MKRLGLTAQNRGTSRSELSPSKNLRRNGLPLTSENRSPKAKKNLMRDGRRRQAT